MSYHPETREHAGVASDHSNLIRQHFETRQSRQNGSTQGHPIPSGAPPVARPLPKKEESASSQDNAPPPQVTSTAALLALLFGRH